MESVRPVEVMQVVNITQQIGLDFEQSSGKANVFSRLVCPLRDKRGRVLKKVELRTFLFSHHEAQWHRPVCVRVTYLRKCSWLFGSSCLGASRQGMLGLEVILTSTFLAIRRGFHAMPQPAGLPATAMGAVAPREVLVQMLVCELVP